MIVTRKLHAMIRLSMLAILFSVIDMQIGFTEEDGMKKEDFQVSVDAQRIEFTKPVIFKDGAWFSAFRAVCQTTRIEGRIPRRYGDGGALRRCGIGTLCATPIPR